MRSASDLCRGMYKKGKDSGFQARNQNFVKGGGAAHRGLTKDTLILFFLNGGGGVVKMFTHRQLFFQVLDTLFLEFGLFFLEIT